MVDFSRLQSGTGISGDCGSDAPEETRLCKEVAGQITGAFVYWLSQKVQKNSVMLNICVGRDEDPSAEDLSEGVFEAIALWGAAIHDAGIATAKATAAAPVLPCFDIDGSIMITASKNKNGFIFFTAEGEPGEEDVKEILRLASRYNFIGGEYEKEDINLMQMYEMYSRQNPDLR